MNPDYLRSVIGQYVPDFLLEQVSTQALETMALAKAPASNSHHPLYHQRDGGLLLHVQEVLNYSLLLGKEMGANLQTLTVASLVHDVEKVRDYEKGIFGWRSTPYKRFINHVAGSHAWFVSRAGTGFPEIEHVLLSHHGRKEWGSPVEPQTKEAMIFHFADMLSANYGDGREREEESGS